MLEFYDNKEISYLYCRIFDSLQKLETLIKCLGKRNKSIYRKIEQMVIELRKMNIVSDREYHILASIIKIRKYLAQEFFIDQGQGLSSYHILEFAFSDSIEDNLKVVNKFILKAIDFIKKLIENTPVKSGNIIKVNFNLKR